MESERVTFSPPPYPYERLARVKEAAAHHDDGAIECSIGTPCDPPAPAVLEALARGDGARGYPPSAGTREYREAAGEWMRRRFSLESAPTHLAACVGTKEFVASLAGFLHRRSPERNLVLFPEVSYPTYAMGATLAGLESRAVPLRDGVLDLSAVTPAERDRALVVWSNSPSNPTGRLDDLEAVATWGREHGVLVASDECYADFTWLGRPRSILEHGVEGVLAVHSVSKRSNLAGVRAGFYAGDPGVVEYLRLVRQHAGLMVAAPVQAAVAVAYADDEHVERQRERYWGRLDRLRAALLGVGVECEEPEGSFYLWCRHDEHDGWSLATRLADVSGLVTSPGEFYGSGESGHVRIAVVQPDERLELAARRLEERAGDF